MVSSIETVLYLASLISGGFLQTAQTWANVRVCGASCAHVLGSMFVCLLFVLGSMFVCLLFVLGSSRFVCLLFVLGSRFVCLLFVLGSRFVCLLFVR